jgi:hypothetical protein
VAGLVLILIVPDSASAGVDVYRFLCRVDVDDLVLQYLEKYL